MSATARLAEHLAALDPARIDARAADHVGLVFQDTLACMIAGLRDHSVAALARALGARGLCEPLTGAQGTPGDIALLLGFAGAALELDEGNYAAGGHPAVHAAAAALAEAAVRGAGKHDRLAAFLAGYEAGARVGYATALRPAAHPHGTWGAVGAVVAAARLRGFAPDRIAAVIDLAAGLGCATSAGAPVAGGDVRSAWVGVAARNGILACDLLEAGVSGEPGGCAAVFGHVIGTAFDTDRLVEALEERLFILENFMKLDACCRETQGALAALDAALASGAATARDVDRVEIETFADAARLSNTAPANAMAARFSIPAAIAARLLDGAVGVDAFRGGRLAQPGFRALMAAVTVREAPDATAALPDRRICRCSLVLSSGERLGAAVTDAPGDPGNPLPRPQLERKAAHLRAR